jgi:hypothetical protein
VIERWLAAVRDHPQRPAALQCHALTMLALRLDWATGRGFASVRDIAADASASDHTVKRATRWARSDAAGLLVLTRRGHRRGDGTPVASEWQLTVPVDNRSQGATGGTLRSQGANGAGLKVPAAASQGATGATHQESSPSKPSLSRACAELRAVVADASERETEIIIANLRSRGARSPLAVLRREITDGGAQELIAEARSRPVAAAAPGTPVRTASCRSDDHENCPRPGDCTCQCHEMARAAS